MAPSKGLSSHRNWKLAKNGMLFQKVSQQSAQKKMQPIKQKKQCSRYIADNHPSPLRAFVSGRDSKKHHHQHASGTSSLGLASPQLSPLLALPPFPAAPFRRLGFPCSPCLSLCVGGVGFRENSRATSSSLLFLLVFVALQMKVRSLPYNAPPLCRIAVFIGQTIVPPSYTHGALCDPGGTEFHFKNPSQREPPT